MSFLKGAERLKRVPIAKALAAIMDDLFFVAGAAFLAVCAFQIYHPAGYGVIGAALLFLAYMMAKQRGRG